VRARANVGGCNCVPSTPRSGERAQARGQVVERERAKVGILITLTDPTTTMKREATPAGLYKPSADQEWRTSFDRIQILTIEDLFEGKRPAVPWIDRSGRRRRRRTRWICNYAAITLMPPARERGLRDQLPFQRAFLLGFMAASLSWLQRDARRMATILIVEDEEQVRVLAESVLRAAGHTAISAIGEEGAKALLETDRQIDVLFIDLNLGADPEAGLRLAQETQERRPKLAYLYTTGSAVNEGMKALFVEPFLFLPKPYTLEQLTKSVEFLLLRAKPRIRLQLPE